MPEHELLQHVVVSQEEMARWPVDRARSGNKLWAETTWGGDPPLKRRLFNWNIWPCRVVFLVKDSGRVARGEARWRRSGLSIRMRGLKLLSAASGKEIADARVVHYDQERVVVEWNPVDGAGLDGAGIYHLYYGAFEESCFAPSPAWLAEAASCVAPVEAQALRIESRCALDSFYPMETVATPGEVEALLARHPDAPYLAYAEDRDRPIKLELEIPEHWAREGPRSSLSLQADRGEYRVFQIGLWACREDVREVRFTSDATTLPSGSVQCLTTESRITSAWTRRPDPAPTVHRGQIRAFWFGIDLPESLAPGSYPILVRVEPKGLPAVEVRVDLRVSDRVVERRGDHDLRRLSRLRWLESDVGLSDEVFPPYRKLRVSREKRTVATWGHTYELGAGGLPASIRVGSRNVLAAPIALEARAGGAPVRWRPRAVSWTGSAVQAAKWKVVSTGAGTELTVSGTIEPDGCAVIELRLTGDGRRRLDDLKLRIPYRPEHATLASGLGYRGRRTGERACRWMGRGARGFPPSLWMGSVEAGLAWITWHREIDVVGAFGKEQGQEASGRSAWEDLTRPDAAVVCEEDGAVTLELRFGSHRPADEKPWQLRFALLPTPVKPRDSRHWQFRYLHRGGDFEPSDGDTPQSFLRDGERRLKEVKELGVKRLNLHDWWGPAFNYPWQWEGPDNLARLTEEAHRRGVFVKVYNSGRELSTLAPEFWAMLYEGGGYVHATEYDPHPEETMKFQDAWRQNHLSDTITKAGWPRLHPDHGNEHAVSVSNATRIGNFYLESMRYMTEEFGTDGAYWDGADGPTLGHREMAKRLWTIFRQVKPDAAIDVHHGNDLVSSPVTSSILCWPFIDSLWHGEGFPYETFDPWAWLVEISGIPFNVPSELLGGDEFFCRAMLFGIWPRAGWGAGTEKQRRLWAFFDEMGIEEAVMRGFWSGPTGVTVDRPDMYTTTFTRRGKGALVVVASWHPPLASWMGETLDVSLGLDRKLLGLPSGELVATDVLRGESVDVTRPVPLPDHRDGRLLWVRRSR